MAVAGLQTLCALTAPMPTEVTSTTRMIAIVSDMRLILLVMFILCSLGVMGYGGGLACEFASSINIRCKNRYVFYLVYQDYPVRKAESYTILLGACRILTHIATRLPNLQDIDTLFKRYLQYIDRKKRSILVGLK